MYALRVFVLFLFFSRKGLRKMMKYGALLQNTYMYTYKCTDGLQEENVPDRSDLLAENRTYKAESHRTYDLRS